MTAILRPLSSGIAISALLGAVLSAALWFLGAYLGFGEARPFESVTGRLVGLAVLWIAVLLLILVILLRRQRRESAMTEEIVGGPEPAGTPGAPADEETRAELEEMRGKLREGLVHLKKSRLGRRSLYELPWYVIIGPPGAGKTTAIINSGLSFPLADDIGRSAVGGVGGTRNCDWWFTDEAVLVDTAGRYTTQESDAEADNAAWLGFLGILKKYRKRQPINGAVVAISLSDLSMQDEVTQKGHAVAIRRRLSELRSRLGVRFPVYVLFTKADLLAGFAEFFEPLGKEAREQVWGFTLPLHAPRRGPVAAGPGDIEAVFDREFDALLDQLNAHSLERLQAETDPQRRALAASFPVQLASIAPVARTFLTELFSSNRYDEDQMLRGVYLTSGTQEGTPIDRLMMNMSRSFGIGRQAIGSGQGTGRSYFLTGLFKNVMFPESGLVSADDKAERRFRWTRAGAIAATLLIAAGAGALWTRSYIGNRAMAQDIAGQVALYRKAEAQFPGGPIADTDLPMVEPALSLLRELPGSPVPGAAPVPAGLGWGLYQGRVIGDQAAQSYRAALNQHFLPRLLLRLEEQMQGSINNPDLLYDMLKVYLTLGLVGPMNTELISDWLRADWALAYPGAAREPLRAALARHLDALLAQPMLAIDLNNDLVEQVQDILAQMPQAQRVYNGILASPAATALAQWRPSDVGGPALSRALTRSSGKPLTEGIDGIFTYAGFNEVFLGEALGVAKRIQADAWVLGDAAGGGQSDASLMVLSRDVLSLYYDDYVSRYDRLLADLDIVPLQSLSHAVEVTNVLSGPASPIVNILTAVAEETDLTRARAPAEAAAGTQGASAGAQAVGEQQLQRRLSLSARVFLEAMSAAEAAPGAAPPEPGEYVAQRFAWLHDLVARADGQPSRLDLMIGTLTEVYQELNKMTFPGAGAGGGGRQADSPALARFTQAAAELPGPMQRWASQIAGASSGIAADGTRAGIDAAWKSDILPFCTQAVSEAYPFNRRAAREIAMQDFTRLFAPGGMIDGFFKDNLAPIVDTSTRPWSWKPVNGTDLGISPAVLEQFMNAAIIRDAFFAGAPTPSVAFQITPEALDPKAEAIILNIDGQEVAYRHSDGQPLPVGLRWPGQVGIGRVSFEPRQLQSESALSREGPWGWFRLLEAAEIRKTDLPDRKRMIFKIGGRIAIFQMQSGSVLNPFALPALSEFSCPSSF